MIKIDVGVYPTLLNKNKGLGQMTRNQIEWAKQHDWFSHVEDQGLICCVDRQVCLDNGKVVETAVFFTDFSELKDWAGY